MKKGIPPWTVLEAAKAGHHGTESDATLDHPHKRADSTNYSMFNSTDGSLSETLPAGDKKLTRYCH